MASPILSLIEASLVCCKCSKPKKECDLLGLCWEPCFCGFTKGVGEECSNQHNHARVLAQKMDCACCRPFATRTVCAEARNLQTPCRCACHRKDIRAAHSELYPDRTP